MVEKIFSTKNNRSVNRYGFFYLQYDESTNFDAKLTVYR